jgi:hypothetical protein
VPDAHLPTGAACEGYGDAIGDTGGFGEEETGYGSPCATEGWHIAAVLEEGVAYSEVSELRPSGFGLGLLREDGGELVVLGSTGALQPGPYSVYLRPSGTLHRLAAYSGIRGQGNVVWPDTTRNRLVFVAPLTTQLGAADIILERPGSQIVVSGLVTYVTFSERSGTRFLRSLFPDDWATGAYDPTVEA